MHKKINHSKNVKRSERKPQIIFGKKVFRSLIQNRELKYRDDFYNLLDSVLGDIKRSHYTYRTWFTNPLTLPLLESRTYYLMADCLLATYAKQCDDMKTNYNTLNDEYRAETSV